jgi:hypothetical protein
MTGAIVVMFSLAMTSYILTVNPRQREKYAWKSRPVYPGNVDCVKYNDSFGILCVSEFSFSPSSSYAIIIPDYVNVISMNIDPTSGCFITYNYTGPNWTLRAGIQ